MDHAWSKTNGPDHGDSRIGVVGIHRDYGGASQHGSDLTWDERLKNATLLPAARIPFLPGYRQSGCPGKSFAAQCLDSYQCGQQVLNVASHRRSVSGDGPTSVATMVLGDVAMMSSLQSRRSCQGVNQTGGKVSPPKAHRKPTDEPPGKAGCGSSASLV